MLKLSSIRQRVLNDGLAAQDYSSNYNDHVSSQQLNLSTMVTLETEESSGCREVAVMGK